MRRRSAFLVLAAGLGAGSGVVVARAWRRRRNDLDGVREVEHAVTVYRPVDEVYAYWRDLERLPTFMTHLERVEVLDEKRSRWTAHAPGGGTVSWEAFIDTDEPGRLLAWSAAATRGPAVNSGQVEFNPAPGDRGTEVHVRLRYVPLAGRVGVIAARLAGEEPGQQVRDDLRRFKQILETGEVLQADSGVSARGPAAVRLTAIAGGRHRSGGRL